MSNEVDKRIVEMEFRNSEFEKNASKTLSTLEALKAKLNDNFSTNGPEQLNAAIKAVDVSPISKGIDAIQVQFNALQIAGKRVIENIVDAAMNGIANVKNKLTGVVNQIKVGGANRAQNIEQAKFMLEGFGIEWAQIEQDISYGVQDTAYGLDAAAKVASQLVASNVSLGDDMKQALLGISGVAAMTNSTYEDIGRIYTQVAGQGRLMGQQLLQLSGRGLNAAAELSKALNVTEAEVRDMVSKGKIDFNTFSKAMNDAFGQHAKDANKTFNGALLNTKAALSRLGADIQTQKFESFRLILLEVTTKLKDLKKALKPVEDSIISMMDAVGKLVTAFIKSVDIKGMVEKITPSITKFTNFITDVATAWRELHETQEKLNSIKFSNIADYYQQRANALKETTDEVKESVDKLTKITPDQKDKAWEIWNLGKYGNGADRVKALGADYEMVQAYVEKMIELGWDEAKMNEYLAEQTKKVEKAETRSNRAEKLKTTVSKVLTIFGNLKRVLSNVTKSIVNILNAAFGGLSDAVSGKGKGFLDTMVSATGAVADFSDKIAITKSRAEKIRPIAKAIGDVIVVIAKGLVNATKFLVQFIKAASESKIVRGIIDAIAAAITAVFNALRNVHTKLKESGVWDKFVDILKIVATWLGERIIDALNLFGDIASGIGSGVISIFEKITGKIKDMGDESERGKSWLDKIKDFFKEDVLNGSWLTKLKDIITDIFGTGKDVFQTAFERGSDFINGLVKGLKNLDQQDLETIIKMLSNVALTLTTIKWLWSMSRANKGIVNMTEGITAILETLSKTVKKYGKRADAERFKAFATSVATIVGSLIGLMITYAALEGLGFDAKRILIIAGVVVGIISLITGAILIIITKLTKEQGNFNKTTSILGKFKIPAFAAFLISLAYFIKTILQVILTVYNMVKSEDFDQAKFLTIAGIVTGVTAALAVLMAIISRSEKKLMGFGGLAFSLIAIAILLKTMVSSFKTVLKIIKGEDEDVVEDAADTLISFLTPILIFGGAIALINKIPSNATTSTNPFKGMMTMFIGLALLLRVGFVPLLKTLTDIRKEGSKGTAAINDLKSILNTLMIFIGLMTLIFAVFDRVFSMDGNTYGSQFIKGKYIGDVKKGGFSTSSKGSAVWGIVGMIGAMALMFAAIGYALKSTKDVKSSNLEEFKKMTTTLLVILGILGAVGAVAGAVDKSGGAVFGILAIAALIASLAAVMIGAGLGFKMFETALREFIDALPDMVDKLLEFFKKIADNKDKITKGVYLTVSTFFEALTAAVVAWTEGLSKSVPIMVAALFDCVIVTLNGVADQFLTRSDELVAAADRCAVGILYFLSLAIQKVQERGKGIFGDFIGKLMYDSMNPVTRKLLGWEIEDFEYTGPDPEELKKEMEEKGKTSADYFYKNYYKGLAEGAAESSSSGEYNLLSDFFENSLDTSKLPSYVQGILGDKAVDVNKYLKNNFTNKLTLGEINVEDISEGMLGNMDAINEKLGVTLNPETFENMFDGVDLSDPDAIDQALAAIEGFDADSDLIMADWSDDMTEYGTIGFDNFTEGMEKKEEQVQQMATQISDNLVAKLESYEPKMYVAGKFLLDGFNAGLADEEGTRTTYKNVADMVRSARRRLEEEAEIKSPSKVFMRLGKFITLGFAEGIAKNAEKSNRATQEAGEATILTMRETIKKLSLEAADSLDSSPRITPILDMSNVTEGINSMNSMFDTTHSYKLGAVTSTEARGATSRRVNAVYQNGSNFDDTNTVASINSLRDELSTLKDSISGMQVVMDSRALVGQIATPMDKALGKKVLAGRRKV